MICVLTHKGYGNSTLEWYPDYKQALHAIMEGKSSTAKFQVYEVSADAVSQVYPKEVKDDE